MSAVHEDADKTNTIQNIAHHLYSIILSFKNNPLDPRQQVRQHQQNADELRCMLAQP